MQPLRGTARRLGESAGVVDPDVDLAEVVHGRPRHRRELIEIGDVRRLNNRPPSARGDLVPHRLQVRPAARGQQHVGPLRSERERDRAADSPARACDDARLPGK